MLGSGLKGGGDRDGAVALQAAEGMDRVQLQFPAGQGTGLVEGEQVAAGQPFHRLPTGNQKAAVGQAAISGAVQAGLVEAEGQTTRVDTDQELQRLLIVEQAYAANARVIETIDRLIQNLLEI